MNNILYKGIVKITMSNGNSRIVSNTGTTTLGKIICKSLLPDESIDDKLKPYKINLSSNGRNCFGRVVPITGAIYGTVEELPEEIKNIVVLKKSDEEIITMKDVTLGFVRFVSSMIKNGTDDRFSSSSPSKLKLSMYNYVNDELAYIEEDLYNTLSSAYSEIRNGEEVIVDWFMLIVNGQVE